MANGVSESERIWKSIDRLNSAVGKLCERVTANETSVDSFKTYQTNHQKHKDRQTVIILGVMGAVLTAVNIFV